jgi:hypothetical protein
LICGFGVIVVSTWIHATRDGGEAHIDCGLIGSCGVKIEMGIPIAIKWLHAPRKLAASVYKSRVSNGKIGSGHSFDARNCGDVINVGVIRELCELARIRNFVPSKV